jgi:hypothetical protein
LNTIRRVVQIVVAASIVSFAAIGGAPAEKANKPFEPTPGMPGKDSVWVPTPLATLEKMFDMAKLTPKDFVIDLGSGDGRAIIAAGKRGARGVGVEWNDDLIAVSNKTAAEAGVSHLAKFVKHDMFTYDISEATVMALFMLPDQLGKLAPKFLDLRPGSRIVMNGFTIPGWTPDETGKATGDCGSWCTSHLYYVPAKVAGTWRLGDGDLTLTQNFQMLTGTLTADGKSTPISNGRMNGEEITFSVGDAKYTGRVKGNTISGEITGASSTNWSATRK